jgi:hypothetical protein
LNGFQLFKTPKISYANQACRYELTYSDEYIKYLVDGKLKRNVFYNVPLEDIELD